MNASPQTTIPDAALDLLGLAANREYISVVPNQPNDKTYEIALWLVGHDLLRVAHEKEQRVSEAVFKITIAGLLIAKHRPFYALARTPS